MVMSRKIIETPGDGERPPAGQRDGRRDIKDLSKDELSEWMDRHGMEPYRAGQILKWIYSEQMDDFSRMTNLKKSLRALLDAHFVSDRLRLEKVRESGDGSKKFLFGLKDGNRVESVLIPGKNRYAVCVSTQAGCAQGCRFCRTARSGLTRNLSAGEIVGQVRDILNMPPPDFPIANVVMMGMGEPLANYGPAITALNVLTDPSEGLKFAPRKVTVSTSGVVPGIDDLGRDSRANLAVSLNASDNPTRSMLMPVNRKYPIEALLEACRRYPLTPRRRITFEYILIRGVNDSDENARALSALLSGVRSKINLIPFNVFPGSPFKRPDDSAIERFREILVEKGHTAITRRSRGQDISAACGQLSADAAGS
ncbi:Dual-specificity RNA methyltransferase RlmN [Candidatus Desulfarcum epimagneticum]|uniref:Probable dual-specificity RNA methyltransferase RlmN n=1 Tax=uncultured Desulfobacteraceae bacterium TaxID=218296 RepID=A0A484HJZ1_9BACT|nr:Dual-specificity RNA methyltransferase RlmN [uncultured Desulfobacteraceae bacterium]